MTEHLKHTPVPWHSNSSSYPDTIHPKDELQQIAVICELSVKKGMAKGNRDFILRACNNHQKLLNLAERFVDAIDAEGEHDEGEHDEGMHDIDECDVCDVVDDAMRLLADLKKEKHD